ncbi:ribosome silencing factor [Lactobacillus mulieris]|uniref:Ribosomal silencing factor RsfS n=1 Tax=Lactobacillus mulieris TaxID=2508708 RepID=A0AAP3GWX3_9LACO|nr:MULTISPECIES: ribosome silencing factor [Lactobacillus]EEU21090.1 iojap-like ribosome-associated protein [Lactobacillus jensenii 27-2-CHN]EEX23964.1 iojap-like protein [Lactobacillus jensenii 115-3-CHN]EFH29138.1 iojap-like protein [Lactobacillus jensenii JV-V16]KAA9244407.1 ribosome silencing factor [Lactobacillus jensenii]KAA9369430.1 ribosome silencing factor [Lactobacillus jensenii]
MNSEKLLDITLDAISDRHGEATEAYDMRGISILADFYIVTSASSNRQLHALVNSILDKVREYDYHDYRVEGTRDSNWLLVDLGDIVVNIFTEDARDFYGLESLWANGKKLDIPED